MGPPLAEGAASRKGRFGRGRVKRPRVLGTGRITKGRKGAKGVGNQGPGLGRVRRRLVPSRTINKDGIHGPKPSRPGPAVSVPTSGPPRWYSVCNF